MFFTFAEEQLVPTFKVSDMEYPDNKLLIQKPSSFTRLCKVAYIAAIWLKFVSTELKFVCLI